MTFKTGQAWRTRKGDILEITVRDDGAITSPECDVALEPNGRFYRDGSSLESIYDLVEQVMRVYICGPMTGLPEKNYPAFNELAALYRKRGCFVINPAELHDDEDKPHSEYMRVDIAALLTCDMVAVLPGYSMSAGATVELSVALACGLSIVWPQQ